MNEVISLHCAVQDVAIVIGKRHLQRLKGRGGAPWLRTGSRGKHFVPKLHRGHWPEFEDEAEVRPMFEPGGGP